MKNNLFGISESVVERALREERERADLFRNALGGSEIIRTIKQATEEQKLLRSLDLDAPYRAAREALAQERERRKAFKQLASTAWALSVQETARSIVQQHQDLIKQQRHLASSVIETVKAFDTNRSAVATAIAVASAGESYRRMVADALPGFSVYGAIAERMRMLEAMTLRASNEVTLSATALAAETVLEAQRLVEAIAQAPTDEEGARLFGDLLDAVLAFVTRLGPNTIPELQKMGLVGFATFIMGILSLYTLSPQAPTQSPQDKAAFAELSRKVENLREETRRYHEVEAHADEAYIANLPRAELSRNATFRGRPTRNGEVVLKAPKGMLVAIAAKQGRWRLVIFRDPLSGQLARAWVYGTAVAPFDHGVGN